jgi:hypothetical protein
MNKFTVWWSIIHTRQAIHVQHDTHTCSGSHCCLVQAISMKYYECVYIPAVVILHANRFFPAPLSSAACLALSYFPHYLINDSVFEKKMLLVMKCVEIFSKSFVWNVSHSKKNSANMINVNRPSCRVPVVFVIFLRNLNFLHRFSKNSQI